MFTRWPAVRLASAGALVAVATVAAPAQGPRLIDTADYQNRLRGMWLGECVANWTGLKTEGAVNGAPFLTDQAWGTSPFPDTRPWVFLDYHLFADPWLSDDDTDLEYTYLHLLDRHDATTLTAAQIADGWALHVNRYIWVSNASARALIGRGIRPPATALAQGLAEGAPPVDNALMIDAQLTTEIFGALAPGMPHKALEMADLPIRATAKGYAAHASQFHVVLYALATQTDRSLPMRDQILWLVRESRRFIPDTSKTADVVDFVLADYLANPDKDDWERTRDAAAARYQTNAPANGFVHRAWYESTVNFATGLIALLYGEGDYRKTVRIGTLSGWDSDNGTATMGGLLGLMLGHDGVRAQFPGWNLSDRYLISRTRDAMPDRTPGDPTCDDTLTLMAARMLPITELAIREAGGLVSESRWLLPPETPVTDALARTPTDREQRRSANLRFNLRATGGPASAACSVPAAPAAGSADAAFIAQGTESDFRGLEDFGGGHAYFSSQNAASPPAPGQAVTLTVTYPEPVDVATVRFTEGDHLQSGGWFEWAAVEVLVNGVWTAPQMTASDAPDPTRPFQIIDFALASPTRAAAIRITGLPGGSQRFVTCLGLDALATDPGPAAPTFDLDGDGSVTVEDLYARHASPQGLDADYLEAAIRWQETKGMSRGR